MNESHYYIYLHGFASSPLSAKADYLRNRFAESNLNLIIPDLNDNDFTNLTLSRQIQQVEKLLPPSDIPVTIIGSSFGGLTAVWLAEKHQQINRLILLAPAFNFRTHLQSSLDNNQLKKWEKEGYLPVYHYGEKRNLPLSYQFFLDLQQYDLSLIKRAVSTLIIHGINDEAIPIKSSQNYAKERKWVELIELNSDHSLVDVREKIWELIINFLS
jgi:predicted esterase YcpF (UPF0227 family)